MWSEALHVVVSVSVLQWEDFLKARLMRLCSVGAKLHLFLRKQSENTTQVWRFQGCDHAIAETYTLYVFNRVNVILFRRQPREEQRSQVVKCGSQILAAVESPGSILQTGYRLQHKQIFDPAALSRSKHLLLQIYLKLLPQKGSKRGASFQPPAECGCS